MPAHWAKHPAFAPMAARRGIRVLEENEVYSRYMTIYNRRVQFAGLDGAGAKEFEFDVVGHPKSDFRFAVVMPVHLPASPGEPFTTTLVWEYAQGLDAMCAGFPTGGWDARKHTNIADTARAELEEEARLAGGELTCLVDAATHPGLTESKWCRNRFYPFVCVGTAPAIAPASRDDEEVAMRTCRVSLAELEHLAVSGDMLAPSVQTMYLALAWLRRRGVIR